MTTTTDPTARLGELARAFQTAIDLGTAHLRTAVEAEEGSADRAELVQLARGELAIAETMLGARRKLLAPDAPHDTLADRSVLGSIAKLPALADEMDEAPPLSLPRYPLERRRTK